MVLPNLLAVVGLKIGGIFFVTVSFIFPFFISNIYKSGRIGLT